jgi:hypothetical protein
MPQQRLTRILCLMGWMAFIGSAICHLSAQTAPDLSTVPPDLTIPALSEGEPAPGKRVRLVLNKDGPPVILYLPTDWVPEKSFPILVELPGNGNFRNAYGDSCTGLPEDCKLGYGFERRQGHDLAVFAVPE